MNSIPQERVKYTYFITSNLTLNLYHYTQIHTNVKYLRSVVIFLSYLFILICLHKLMTNIHNPLLDQNTPTQTFENVGILFSSLILVVEIFRHSKKIETIVKSWETSHNISCSVSEQQINARFFFSFCLPQSLLLMPSVCQPHLSLSCPAAGHSAFYQTNRCIGILILNIDFICII